MPCSTRIRCAEWVRRSASCAAARAGGTGSWLFRRAGRGCQQVGVFSSPAAESCTPQAPKSVRGQLLHECAGALVGIDLRRYSTG
jgi:hypothetical protein